MLAAASRLADAEIDTPQLDSAVLLAHVLSVSKAWLYAHPRRQLTKDEIGKYEALVRRRMCHEPTAYLIGYRSFYGLDVTVDRRVLIPRPETEMLVERVLAHLKEMIGEGQTPRVVDVGTGSGAIATAIAVNVPQVVVYATDVSEDALQVAAQNVWRYGLGEQVQLIPGDLLDALPRGLRRAGLPEPVDVIVANLPYVATPALQGLARQVRDYEPILALDGGPDGLQVIGHFFRSLQTPAGRGMLRPEARLYLEIGMDQGAAARAIAESAFPEARVEVHVDYAGLDRVVQVAT